MNLCIFLAIGESFADFKNKGQYSLIINNNLRYYSRNFKNVYVFSYENESFKLFNNVFVIPNRYRLHRFIYSILLPILNSKIIKSCRICRGYQLTGGIPCFIAKIFYDRKYVVNYGYDYVKYARIEGKKVSSLLFKLLEFTILTFSSYIIATTRVLKNHVRKFNKNIMVIPNGVDIRVFKPKYYHKSVDILYVGRLEKQKNLDVLIKSISLVKKQKLKVLFIGSGSMKDHLISLARAYNIDLNIIAKISNNKLPEYYNRSKVFILPSVIEGNPKSLLEAMSCGLAVVGNNVSGISSLIKHGNGELFNNSSSSLTRSISRIMNNKMYRDSLGKKARKFIEVNYNLENTFKKEIFLLKRPI